MKIQGGYSSEATVFASLLGHRGSRYEALVIYHASNVEESGAGRFEADSDAKLVRLDCGTRANTDGRRGALSKMASMLRYRASFPKMASIAAGFGPDVVYSSQQLWDSAAASYIARRLGRPHVMHLHYVVDEALRTGFSGSPRSTRLAMKALRLDDPLQRLKECEHVVAISEFIRGEAIGHGVQSCRVTTVRNSLAALPLPVAEIRGEVRRELCTDDEARVVGIVGRLDPGKGQDDTIKAFAQATAERPGAVLLVVGSGPQRPALELAAADLGLAGRVRFLGQRDDVPRLLVAMDVFAHPSRREPFGLAIAEASAASLPVVAYREGGVPEIVVDGETGLLAAPGDIGELARHIGRLLDEPATAHGMGRAGRDRICREFRPEDAAARFSNVLRQAVKN